MQRQRGGLVPIGEASADVPGPVQALIPSPPTQRHFTLADQVNQLVTASEADPDLGFMARMMALCSLPRTNPGNRLQYKRVNGPYKLIMIAGGDCKLPFGNLPRLLLAWVSTEAVRTQNRELVLGKSLAEFMRALGIYNSGGKPQTRLRNQMDRLFHASVQLIYEDEGNKAGISSFVADRTELWWKRRKPDEPTLWESKIYLSEPFFNEIIRHPVPLDMNTLTASSAARWASISTCGSPTAPLRFVLATAHLEGRCTASSEWTQPRPAITNRSRLRYKLLPVEEDQAGLAGVELHNGRGVLILLPSTPAIAPVHAATAGPIALRKPQECSATRRRCFGGGEDGQVRWEKSRQPTSWTQTGDPCDLRQPRQVFAMRVFLYESEQIAPADPSCKKCLRLRHSPRRMKGRPEPPASR